MTGARNAGGKTGIRARIYFYLEVLPVLLKQKSVKGGGGRVKQ